uniref:HDH1m n=1 Tax=Chlamydomonas reinhardtii TaxID=3055 RepID=D5LAZ3_CHLRE|nr:HDH1m [Chlamydomonas reinhardtii]
MYTRMQSCSWRVRCGASNTAAPMRGAVLKRCLLAAVSESKNIRLIVTDVDGTLLDSSQQLSPRVEAAVKEARALGVPLVIATGKARGPWTADVLLGLQLDTPGVFMQGLIVYDDQGRVLHERRLCEDVARDCITLAADVGVTLTAYCGDRILCAATDVHTDRLLFYKEPPPEPVGDLAAALGGGGVPVHKMIFMADQDRIDALRPAAEALLDGRASLTTALTGMLEVLPLGGSKGAGLSWLLDWLGVAPEQVLALGDGENDVEMLQLAGLGVAMGNAGPKARAAADVVLAATNDQDGVAEAIQRFVLEPARQRRQQQGHVLMS